ncbi:MAG: type I methionyl aminopeptidase [Chloroflexota bacterium]|nr:type I methionyl aminopeptidase [Chloroflexota bacterium]
MTISIKSQRELEKMRVAGRIVADVLRELREAIEPGMTTKDIDRISERAIRGADAEPAFPYIDDFPGTVCVSVNEEVVHGIPGKRVLHDGDIVKLDVGALFDGYHGDAAVTVPVGEVSDEARRLIEVTNGALAAGIEAVRPGAFLNDIGSAIEDHVRSSGFSIVRQYVGHGVGRELHEEPEVFHFRQPYRGARLRPGMTLTIEPMINAGTYQTLTLRDGWTVVTRDRRLSAQFEHTVAVTEDGYEIMTLPERGSVWGVPREASKPVQ